MEHATQETDPNELAETHLHLVGRVVQRLASGFPRHVERDELRAAGAAGLVDAAHRYDPDSGIPFARYASIRIRGAVLDATRTRDWATRRLRRDLRAIENASASLEKQLQRRPDDEEIAAALELDVRTVLGRRAAEITSTLLALDRSVGDSGGRTATLGDGVAESDHGWLPEQALEHSELVGTLHAAIAHLPEVPRRVLRERHFEGRRICDIARDLGLTDARVSQLRNEALHALRAYFATAFEGVADVPPDAPGRRRRDEFVAGMSTTTWRSRLEGHGPSREEDPGTARIPA